MDIANQAITISFKISCGCRLIEDPISLFLEQLLNLAPRRYNGLTVVFRNSERNGIAINMFEKAHSSNLLQFYNSDKENFYV